MMKIIVKIHKKLKAYLYQVKNTLLLWSYRKNVSYKTRPILKGKLCLTIGKNSIIVIGDSLKIYSSHDNNPISRGLSSSICTEKNAKIIIGDNVGMSSVCIWAHEKIFIGNNVKIGAGTIILDSDCHTLDYLYRRGLEDQLYKVNKEVSIEDDVLIGANCIILKGVVIGERSIIGAGSVITKNIPTGEIWAGNPARFIKKI